MNQELACLDERFTVKLHRLLEDAECQGFEDVLRWNPDGRSFTIYQPKVFAHTIVSAYFKQTQYKSFQRQLNLYDFHRETRDGIRGVYSHPLFDRNNRSLCHQIKRKTSRSSSKKIPKNVSSAHSTSFNRVVIPGFNVLVNSNTPTESKSQRMTFSNALVDQNVIVDLRALDTTFEQKNSAEGDTDSMGTIEGYFGPGGRRLVQYGVAYAPSI